MLSLDQIEYMFAEMGLDSETTRGKFKELTKWATPADKSPSPIYLYNDFNTNSLKGTNENGQLGRDSA